MSNNITVLGNLVKDAETKSGKSDFLVFKVADNAGKDNVVFHECIAFDERLVRIFGQYLTKGKPIFIAGRLENNDYEKDGVTIYKNRILVSDIQFVSIGKKDEDGGSSNQNVSNTNRQKPAQDSFESDDDIPF